MSFTFGFPVYLLCCLDTAAIHYNWLVDEDMKIFIKRAGIWVVIDVSSLIVFPWSQRKRIILPVSLLSPIKGEEEGILRFMKEHTFKVKIFRSFRNRPSCLGPSILNLKVSDTYSTLLHDWTMKKLFALLLFNIFFI